MARFVNAARVCLSALLRWGLPLVVIVLWLDGWDRLLPTSRPVVWQSRLSVYFLGVEQGQLVLQRAEYSAANYSRIELADLSRLVGSSDEYYARPVFYYHYSGLGRDQGDYDDHVVAQVLILGTDRISGRSLSSYTFTLQGSPYWWKGRYLGFYWHRHAVPGTGDIALSEFRAPLWFILVLSLIPMALDLKRTLKVSRRRALARRGKCWKCGYDLRASKERCPECGAAIAGRGVGSGGGERPSATVV
jgi:hypothetical protein